MSRWIRRYPVPVVGALLVVGACSSSELQPGSEKSFTNLAEECSETPPTPGTECDRHGLGCHYCRTGDTSAPLYVCGDPVPTTPLKWRQPDDEACPENHEPHPSCETYKDGEPCPVEGVRCFIYNSSCSPGHADCSGGVWHVTPPTCPA